LFFDVDVWRRCYVMIVCRWVGGGVGMWGGGGGGGGGGGRGLFNFFPNCGLT